MYHRPIYRLIYKRLQEERHFIQVLTGPRQTGKTTLVKQLAGEKAFRIHYATADEPSLKERDWIEQQWETARSLSSLDRRGKKVILALDEIQKIPQWSETVKRMWDEDTMREQSLKVLLLGSSPLLVEKGLTESLAGRFETIPVTHWSFTEMQDAFGWDFDTYAYFGGYPGSAFLIRDLERWKNYIHDALIETTISRDILLMNRVDKPALLRRLFELSCLYSGQILSYQKMMAQLQDAGNTTTLSHYLRLLEGAGLVSGLSKYANQPVRKRASSPKLMVMNSALMNVFTTKTPAELKQDRASWGRVIESVVGAHLINQIKGKQIHLYYWLNRNREVDFVLQRGDELIALEVKSNRKKATMPGILSFKKEFPLKKQLLVGGDGIPVDEFLKVPVNELFV